MHDELLGPMPRGSQHRTSQAPLGAIKQWCFDSHFPDVFKELREKNKIDEQMEKKLDDILSNIF